MAPSENAAWKVGMTVRPIARSMRADSTLNVTLASATATPLSRMPAASRPPERTPGPTPMSV